MDFFDGLTFFIALFIGAIPAVILGIREKKIAGYLLCFSLLMVFSIYSKNPRTLLFLLLYIFIEWHIISIFQYILKKRGKSKAVFHHAVLFSLAPLLISKLSGLVDGSWFSFIGISYITFRALQILIDTYDGVIEHSRLGTTVSFLLFFPSLSSGPIDRSKRFEADLEAQRSRREYLDLLQKGIRKILLGALYKFVLSAVFFAWLEQATGRYDLLSLVLYAYLYGIYMFFDFAGYSLMAVGTAYLFGIQLPDNFNKPFISIDMKDFWNRWHISLSHWFRDFVFSRFMLWAIREKKFKKRANAAAAGFIVNMLIMGAWHGLSFDYLLYGLYHGVLLAVTERFQKTKWYKAHKHQRGFKIVSWFLTLNFVMLGFLIFSGHFTEACQIFINQIL